MLKRKKVTKVEPVSKPIEIVVEVKKINPITQEFGNGDLNVLRDKINEIISRQ